MGRQAIVTIAWSYAKLAYRHDPLLNAIAEVATAQISEYSVLDLSNLAWAFATLN